MNGALTFYLVVAIITVLVVGLEVTVTSDNPRKAGVIYGIICTGLACCFSALYLSILAVIFTALIGWGITRHWIAKNLVTEETEFICDNCEAGISKDDEFCSKCGADVSKTVEEDGKPE